MRRENIIQILWSQIGAIANQLQQHQHSDPDAAIHITGNIGSMKNAQTDDSSSSGHRARHRDNSHRHSRIRAGRWWRRRVMAAGLAAEVTALAAAVS
jgi:hypothetical protein